MSRFRDSRRSRASNMQKGNTVLYGFLRLSEPRSSFVAVQEVVTVLNLTVIVVNDCYECCCYDNC